MTFGSLFAGVGGFDLGFERVGMTCKWQVEIDPFAQKVLAKHWPAVRRWDDVRTFPPEPIGDWRVDVICGGFPCQDISNAGRREGITGARSGLWTEMLRIVRDLRPRYLVVENVAALLTRGMDRVLGDLAEIGLDAEWHCIPAAAVGAPHIRERIFILAHTQHDWISERRRAANVESQSRQRTRVRSNVAPCGKEQAETFLADTDCSRLEKRQRENAGGTRTFYRAQPERSKWWATEPAVGRVANGVPSRVDRLRGLGNAVVPQVAEFIGRRLMEASRD